MPMLTACVKGDTKTCVDALGDGACCFGGKPEGQNSTLEIYNCMPKDMIDKMA